MKKEPESVRDMAWADRQRSGAVNVEFEKVANEPSEGKLSDVAVRVIPDKQKNVVRINREEGCDPSYDDEPCFGIEAYFRADHPLIREEEDPSDCERVLERHMAERWNRRAERTCTIVRGDGEFPHCSACGSLEVASDVAGAYDFCPRCGARVVSE